MHQPLVDIIIPANNSGLYIEETIQSVTNQTYNNYILWIIDDGSNDNTREIVHRIAYNNSKIKYLYQKNSGVSAARNKGFSISNGEYIAFLDADDIWLKDNLQLKVEYLEKYKETDLVHSDTAVVDSNGSRTGETKSGKEGFILDDLLAWNGTCIPAPSSILCRREVIKKTGGFDTQLSTGADQDFFFRVASKYKIGRINQITWEYRIHDNNMHSNISLMEHDTLLTYKKAKKNNLFKSNAFRDYCFSNMYTILAGSWYHNGKNPFKAMKYIIKSIITYPPALLKIASKIKKLMKK